MAPLLGARHGRRQHTPVRAQYRRAKTPHACRHPSERTGHPCRVKPPLLGGPDMATGSTCLHRRSTGEPRHHMPAGAYPSRHYAGLQHCAGRPRHPAASPRNWQADTPDHVAAAQPWSDTLAHLPQRSGWANDEPACPALSAQQCLTPGLRQGLPCPALPLRMAPGRPQGCPSRPGSAKQK